MEDHSTTNNNSGEVPQQYVMNRARKHKRRGQRNHAPPSSSHPPPPPPISSPLPPLHPSRSIKVIKQTTKTVADVFVTGILTKSVADACWKMAGVVPTSVKKMDHNKPSDWLSSSSLKPTFGTGTKSDWTFSTNTAADGVSKKSFTGMDDWSFTTTSRDYDLPAPPPPPLPATTLPKSSPTHAPLPLSSYNTTSFADISHISLYSDLASFVDKSSTDEMERLVRDLALALPLVGDEFVSRRFQAPTTLYVPSRNEGPTPPPGLGNTIESLLLSPTSMANNNTIGGGASKWPSPSEPLSPARLYPSYSTETDMMLERVANIVVSESSDQLSDSWAFPSGFSLSSPEQVVSKSFTPIEEQKQSPMPSLDTSTTGNNSSIITTTLQQHTSSSSSTSSYYHTYDPDRDERVSLVMALAEEERARRIREAEQTTWNEKLARAIRIEWAVIASEAERNRRVLAHTARLEKEERARQHWKQLVSEQEETERKRRVSENPNLGPEKDFLASALLLKEQSVLSTTVTQNLEAIKDYEVICPYSVLGCDVTLPRSELPRHLETCASRAEVIESRRLSQLAEKYNPLDHVVVCPYAVVGCPHSCRRADLPAHLATCPLRSESKAGGVAVMHGNVDYELVCPYTILGCAQTCTKSTLNDHLKVCAFKPRSRQEEEAERETNRAVAIQAEEQERVRRVQQPRGSFDGYLVNNTMPSRMVAGGAGAAPPPPQPQQPPSLSPSSPPDHRANSVNSSNSNGMGSGEQGSRTFTDDRRISWIVQAAEIERMRLHEEETIKQQQQQQQQQQQPPQPQQPIVRTGTTTTTVVSGEATKSTLENVLRRQLLHRKWFPVEALHGRRTHVNTLHDHMEHQAKLLHRALHEEFEKFNRECALWELSTLPARKGLVNKIRTVIEQTWPLLCIAGDATVPKIHVFGSFASDLAVPGVSDLDLVLVPTLGVIKDDSNAMLASEMPMPASLPNSTNSPPDSPGSLLMVSSTNSSPVRTKVPSIRKESIDSLASVTVSQTTSQAPLQGDNVPGPGKLQRWGSLSSEIDRHSNQSSSAAHANGRYTGRDSLAQRDRARSMSMMSGYNMDWEAFEARRKCHGLGAALFKIDFLSDVRVIDTAHIPLVKMRCLSFKPTLDIDLTVALVSHNGLASAEFVRTLRARFPPLPAMVRVLKAFLYSRGLSDPFHGGLSSYALVLMVTCSVIRSYERATPASTGVVPALNLGELMVDFLDLFGREFDWRNEAVVHNPSTDMSRVGVGRIPLGLPLLRVASRSKSHSGSDAVALVVDDPVTLGNNVGRPTFAFVRVQAAFAEMLASLLSHVVRNEAIGRRGGKAPLLERIFGIRIKIPLDTTSEDVGGVDGNVVPVVVG